MIPVLEEWNSEPVDFELTGDIIYLASDFATLTGKSINPSNPQFI
jgi:hypothetical protein